MVGSPPVKLLQTSFSGGEISPELSGRIDLRQYASGASKLLNFLPLPQGPASRRPGTQFVSEEYTAATHRTQLIPFVYSTDQSLCLEFVYGTGSGYVRILDDGQPVQWAAPQDAGDSAWDAATDTLRFTSEHGFSLNDQVRLTVPAPNVLPTGLLTASTYFVIVVDSYTIQLAEIENGLAKVFSGNPPGDVRVFAAGSFPDSWIRSGTGQPGTKAYSGFPSNAQWDCPGHQFVVGDVLRFLTAVATPPVASPPNWRVNQNYYVTEIGGSSGSEWFQISETRGGSNLLPNVIGSGDVTRYYIQGDLIYWDGDTSATRSVRACKADHEPTDERPTSTYWTPQPDNGDLLIATPYEVSKVELLHYAQSNDVMTLVHPAYPPMELRRFGATDWDIREIQFTGVQQKPSFRTSDPIVSTRGQALNIQTIVVSGGGNPQTEFRVGPIPPTGPDITIGVYVAVGDTLTLGALDPGAALVSSLVLGESYLVVNTETAGYGFMVLQKLDGTNVIATSIWISTAHGQTVFYHAAPSSNNEQTYKCTAIGPTGVESIESDAVTSSNNLDVPGSNNVLYINALSSINAKKFRIYKEENGLFGLIGETDNDDPSINGWGELKFTDDGIPPDMSVAPPINDDSLSGTDYPRAVGYFEQRRCFAGTQGNPRQLWMTKNGTESDLSYSLPIRDDDRISVQIAAREAATIRHVVPVSDMLLFTQQGEWRVTSQNSDAITPETVAVRQQSEIGANDVQPIVVNSSVVYAANRGGHVRNMLYSQEVQGYATGDLSLRSSHLFDGMTIKDAAYSKAPYPILWFVSSSGKLLSLTYVPEQEIAGWAVQDVGGTVESICAIPEGNNDTLYMVVKRSVNGVTKRYVERMVPQVVESLVDSIFVDASSSYDGLETRGRTITLTGGNAWRVGDTVQVTASAHLFKGLSDVGDVIELHDSAGSKYRVLITAYQSSTAVTGKLEHAMPMAMRRAAISTWGMGRREITAGAHLEGVTVQVVSDGVIQATQAVAGGVITLVVPGVQVHVGRAYTSDLRTLPLGVPNTPGYGQGRAKNISKAYVRVLDTAGVTIGPDADHQVPVEGLQSALLTTGEMRAVPDGSWTDGGEILIRQLLPQPATVLGVTLQVELGD